MSRPRGGTPLTGAMPSLEAANQAQIEDLVQRNATLSHTIQKLNEQVELERKRGTAAVNDIRDKWQANQKEWKEGCEDLLSSYRIVQKTLEYELAKERSGIYQEMAATREEKLLRLQREYKISLFQMKEEELEGKIEQMEEEHQLQTETLQAALDETKKRCAEYMGKYKEVQELSSRAHRDKEDKETAVTKLRGELANLTAASETLKSKQERTKLQLDGAQTRIADLERTNDELQRTNKDLTRQLEQWKSLETKEGEAAEEQRKHRLTLEVELKQLKEESKEREAEYERTVAKNGRKIEKLQNVVSKLEETVAETEKELSSSRKDVSKLQKQVDKLKADLEEERARVRPPSPQKFPKNPIPVEDEAEDSADEIPVVPVKAQRRNKVATSSKDETADDKPKARKPVIARKSTGGKPPPRRKASPVREEAKDSDSEIEEIPNPAPPKKVAKAKTVDKGKGKKKAEEDEGDSVEEVDEPPPKRKGKRKGRGSDEDNDETANERSTGASKVRNKRDQNEFKDAATKAVKPGSRAVSRQPKGKEQPPQENEAEADGEAKKKKRKINIFPTAPSLDGPSSLAFGNLNALDGNLNIPTVLSPVKDDELVPARSTSMISSLLKLTTRR